MKSKSFLLLAVSLFLAACTGNRTERSDKSSDTVQTDSAKVDTTIYAHSLEYGMNTFVVITEAGDTLELERGNGTIWGNKDHEGDRFALIVEGKDSDDASVGVAINLTNVENITKDFSVSNGRLILEGDTVEILDLTTDSLIAKGKKEYKLGKQK